MPRLMSVFRNATALCFYSVTAICNIKRCKCSSSRLPGRACEATRLSFIYHNLHVERFDSGAINGKAPPSLLSRNLMNSEAYAVASPQSRSLLPT